MPAPEPAPSCPSRSAARRRLARLAAWLPKTAVVLAGWFVLAGCAAYLAPPDSPLARVAARLGPYPAAIVGWRIVFLADDLDVRAAQAAYAKAASAPPEGGSVLDTLVRQQLVDAIGRRLGVRPDAAAVDASMRSMEDAAGGLEALQARIRSLYGWDASAFRSRVVAPAAYAARVEARVLADASAQAAPRAAAQAAAARLDAGEAFAGVARAVNDPRGLVPPDGDIGLRPASELPPSWVDAVSGLADGGHTGVLEGKDQFTVLAVFSRARDPNSQLLLRLGVISVPKRTLDALVSSEQAHTFIWRFVS